MTAENKVEVRRLIDESLVYQRAYNRTLKLTYDMAQEANDQKRVAKDLGEEPDELYTVLKKDLDTMLKKYRDLTDTLWDQAEKLSDKYDEGYQRLAEEVIRAAALDYEVALCGHGTQEAKAEQRRIEDFARNRANYYTTLNFEAVLAKIRAAHAEFTKLCRKEILVIRDETRKARRDGKSVENNTVRCPLCGRPLYAWGNLHRRDIVVRCTGCALQETVTVDDGKN